MKRVNVVTYHEHYKRIKDKLGDSMTPPNHHRRIKYDPNEGWNEGEEISPVVPDFETVNEDGVPYSAADNLINSEVVLAQGKELKTAKVIGHTLDTEGNTVGHSNPLPWLSSVLYDVEFPDGTVKPYAANIIAENILSQVDAEGKRGLCVECILDYATDGDAVTKANQYVTDKKGKRHMRRTTTGWKLLCLLKTGEEHWFPLAELKESIPVDVAEFAVSKGIDDHPAFQWWVPYTLRKRDIIVSKVKARLKKSKVKFGVKVPSTLAKALAFDQANGNTLWARVMAKEMTNVSIAFEILDEDQPIPTGWKLSSGHLVFDVKMDFTRKARWVKDGHKSPDPTTSTYAGVVSRESVRIALTYAALNDLDVTAGNIQNAFLTAPTSEKHYIILDEEFGIENKGKRALIRRALYGGKFAARDYWGHLRSCMEFLGLFS